MGVSLSYALNEAVSRSLITYNNQNQTESNQNSKKNVNFNLNDEIINIEDQEEIVYI